MYYVFHTLIFVSDIYKNEDVKITLEVLFRLLLAPEISPCRSCSTTNIRGLFLEDSDPQEYHTQTNRNFSCNSDLKIDMKRGMISWKDDQLVQHAFLQQCPHVSAMIKGDLSSLLASSLQCFASRWTLGYIWKIRGHYMPLWKRSTPKNWHLTKHHVGKWWIPL